MEHSEAPEGGDEAVRLSMDANLSEAAWRVSERGRSRALLDLVRNRVRLASGSDVFTDPSGTNLGKIFATRLELTCG